MSVRSLAWHVKVFDTAKCFHHRQIWLGVIGYLQLDLVLQQLYQVLPSL